jgi:hypothetical protein
LNVRLGARIGGGWMGRAGRRAAALIALTALSGQHVAQAEPRIVAVGDCFDGPAVLEIEREVGPLAPDVMLHVIEIDGQIEISVREGGHAVGKRSIDAGTAPCTDVVRATALALGLALSDLAITKALLDEPSPPKAAAPPSIALAGAPPALAVLPLATLPARDTSSAVEPPRALQLGLSAEIGLGVAFSAYTSMVAGLAADAAYAPGESWSPEVSGRAGVLASFPSRITIDEVDVWPASYGARVDGCGGVRAEAMRLRACASAVAGALTGDGIQTDTVVALGARIEGTWRASRQVGLFLAVDALSVVRPLWIRTRPGDFLAMGAEETSDLSLLFTSGSNFDWL